MPEDDARRENGTRDREPARGRPDREERIDQDDVPEAENVSEGEAEEISHRRHLRAAVVYEIIRREGDGELARRVSALWWSGLAAGLSIGLSVVGQAVLAAHLPDAPWKLLIERLGYPIGFIVVIMARQQLFTENTLTAVLPVISRMRLKWLLIMLRLWAVVLTANLVGCMIFTAAIIYAPLLPPDVADNVRKISEHMMANSTMAMFVKGIAAGWLIAVLVWMLPSAQNTEFFVIGLLTYAIALGGLTHVVAGAVEAFYLWLQGTATTAAVFLHFLLPTLAGNVVGGTVLFALLSYAQVREELT